MGSVSLFPPALPLRSLFQNPGLQLGRWGEGQLSHIWLHLHSPRAGRAQRGRPPCCTAFPRGHSSSSSDPSGTLEERKGQGEVGEGSLSAQVSAPDPSTLAHLPRSLAPASPTPRKAAGRAAAAERLAAGRRGQGTRTGAPRGGRSGRPQAHDWGWQSAKGHG